ncbi:DUF3263 domain-containing protein [Streptomyces sp. PA5.6]|uniref:DUF3263 domain-containing protein n=1 Tax=Streptomyces sp. PA5.6 TaxID=3035651 RepID=UPI003904D639
MTVHDPDGPEPDEPGGGTDEPDGGADVPDVPDALSPRDRAVLALERRPWPGPGAKERAIREELGMVPVRYYQILNALLDDTRALAHDPITVNRLRRVRESRRDER